ncbi:hypothetical protein J2W55_003664 [Mucilaginibacter pocheonensis]|uniref:Uncharacterized protein n=1 Tax=Mucilaginibacter pocheonensis TaxID=398050 RepID=A0ABU1TEW8_9SPHI|nr:hypothetical protein [Mucilaginibacter pocheonensis]
MLQTTNNVHQQFAGFFNDAQLYPYAYEVPTNWYQKQQRL